MARGELMKRRTYLKGPLHSKIYEYISFRKSVGFTMRNTEYVFKEFVKRDFLDLNVSEIKEFEKFISLHPTFIAKPVDKSGGEGIEKIEIEKETNINELYDRLKAEKKYLLEEFVIQSKFMNDIFPKSVNTLRFVTIRKNGKTTIVHRVIRIGNGNNVVDNFHNGGMYSIINEYGIVEKPAIDRNGNIYSKHPITNHIIDYFISPSRPSISPSASAGSG